MVETGMYSISISLDGLEKTHESFRKVKSGEFNKLMKGLKIMLKTPEISVVQITTCVNKKNIDELEDMFKLLGDTGVKEWRIVEVDPIGRAKANDDILDLVREEWDSMTDPDVLFFNTTWIPGTKKLFKEGHHYFSTLKEEVNGQ